MSSAFESAVPPYATLFETPGARLMMSGWKRAVGRFWSCSFETLVGEAELLTSTTGDSPVTVTVSASLATDIRRSIVIVCPTGNRTPSRMMVVNPCRSALTA